MSVDFINNSCALTDLARQNGTLCRSMNCEPCKKVREEQHKEEEKTLHVDDYIWNCSTDGKEDYAKWILMHYRLPAIQKSMFEPFMKDKKLFCDYEGEIFCVIGASRMGDIWLTSDLEGNFPYQHRVAVNKCSNFRPTA